LIVGLVLLSATLILYFVLSDISAESFSQLEARQVTRNVDRAVNAISNETTTVDTITLDWAWWDDTYTFIEDANERYINSNLGEDTLEGLDLNLMVYINSAGQTIFSSVFDSEQGLMPVPESLEQRLSSDSPLVHHLEADSKVSGILLLPEGPLIIAARPILPSNGEGPIRGSLIFGRYLDDALIEDLSAMTETEIHIFSYDNLPSSPEIEAAQASLSQQVVYVSPLDDDHVAGYTLLQDIYGQPALMLQAKIPREVYAQGQASTSYLRMAIVTVGIVAIVVVFLLLDRQILSRLTSITKGVAKIGQTGDTSSRLVIKGKDELANLGNSVNQMLDALQASQQEIAVSEGRLRLIFESVNDILILMDTEGRILEVNSRVKDISGYEKEEFVGKEIGTLGHITGRRSLDIVVDSFQKRMTGIEVPPYEVEIIRKDGSPVTVEISGVAVKKEGDIVGDLVIARDITPRKKAEAELRQSETRYRLLAENVTDVIWTTEVSCPDRLTYISPSVTRLLGYSVEEAMSKKMEEVFTHTSFERAMKIFAEEMDREEKQGREPSVSRNLDFDLKRADGSIVSVEINFSFIRGADGRPLELLAVGRDITERKKAEQKHRTIIQKTIEGFCITNRNGRLLEVNDSYCKMVGYTREELLNMSAPDLVADEHPWEAAKHIENIVRDGYDRFESQHKHKDGKIVDFEVSANYLSDVGEGQIFVFLRDITEHKKAVARLRESMEKLRLTFKSVPEGITVSDLNGTILETNEATVHRHGYDSKEELIGKSGFELIAEKDHGQAMENLKNVLEKDNTKTVEYSFLRKDGSEFPAELTAALPRDSAGNPVGFVAVTRDITERKRAEEEIRVFSHAVAGAIDAMGITDMKGILIYTNPAMEAIYGYNKGKMLGIPVISLSANPEMANEIMSAVIKTGGWTGEIEAVKKNKETFPALLSISTVRDKADNPIAMMGVTRDLTEQKKMQEQLILTDRLASIGELASGIAHELNNPLTGVIGLSQLLAQKNVPEDIREDLDLVYCEAQRAANVVKNLLTFARKHTPVKEFTDVNEVISKVLELRAYEERVNNIEAVTHLAADLPQIKADHFQLQQVFLNIIINAEHFMIEAHGKGTMTITTEPLGDGVRVSFKDDGPGISRDDLRHIFDPFFTTKEVGKGTGLGLSICHGIVSAHGGQISAESEPGKGATFIIELPLGQE